MDRVRTHVPEDADAPYIRKLQDIVVVRGEAAILNEDVQELAIWISCHGGRSEHDPFVSYRKGFRELHEAAGGAWPIKMVLDESSRKSDQPVAGIATALASARAEWIALLRLVVEGWIPVEQEREGRPDWRVARGERQIDVEVKYKEAVRTWDHRIGWAIKGLSLLPGMTPLHAHEWLVKCPDQVKVGEAISFIETLWECQHALVRVLLSEGMQTGSIPIGDKGHRGLELMSCSGDRLFITDNEKRISVETERCRLPGFISLHVPDAGWVPEEMPHEYVTMLDTILGRTLPARDNATPLPLWAVVWEIPLIWEMRMTTDWLQRTLRETPRSKDHAIALLGMGKFEWKSTPWVLNEHAATLLA